MSFCFPFHNYHCLILVQSCISVIQAPNTADTCSNISAQTKLFIFNLQNHYSFGMYVWNLPYCEVLTVDLCTTSV